jgi:RNA polymerase sigma-70 factor (ECF subfamily)
MIAIQNLSLTRATAQHGEFDTLFRKSRKRAFNLAYRLLGNSSEAEEVTQEAFVRAWKGFDQYDRTRSFDSWLFRIISNLVIDLRRRQKRVPMRSLNEPLAASAEGETFFPELPDSSTNPECVVMQEELDDALRRALENLPEHYRTAVLLSDVEERSYEEIAAITRCPIGTVRSRIHRARMMLRRALEGERGRRKIKPSPRAA